MLDRNTAIALSTAALVLAFLYFQQQPADVPAATPPAPAVVATRSIAYATSITIDGLASEAAWENAPWQPLDQLWMGEPPAPQDFSGRYKLAWDENFLYVLADIHDDQLRDTHPDGLERYWDDDCLEVFVDEDASGGMHQYNYNAFAYHIALDGRIADIRPDSSYAYFTDHCTVKRTTEGNHSTWEIAVRLYDGKRYVDGGDNIPKMLAAGKVIGFALAYCDNDQSPQREHFVGSMPIEGADKNRAWIDAGLFEKVALR